PADALGERLDRPQPDRRPRLRRRAGRAADAAAQRAGVAGGRVAAAVRGERAAGTELLWRTGDVSRRVLPPPGDSPPNPATFHPTPATHVAGSPNATGNTDLGNPRCLRRLRRL